MHYNEEDLLEAVDILVEDYGFDEDYAIDLVLESYEMELLEESDDMFYDEEDLLEAVDILVEDYGFDEDYAIDLVLESYEMELLEESDNIYKDLYHMEREKNKRKSHFTSTGQRTYTAQELRSKQNADKMKQREMDGRAVAAVLGIGGGLAATYYLNKKNNKRRRRRFKLRNRGRM